MTRWLGLSIAVTVLAVAGSLYAYFGAFNQLPERVPTHWNIEGKVDASVPRADSWKYFLLLPAVMAAFTLLTPLLVWLSPRSYNPTRFRPIWDYLMALVVVLFGYLQVVILLGSFGIARDPGRLIVGGVFLFFALLGNVLGKVRRNFWMGVRTPWTLASEVVWNRTHRVAAWLFVLAGVLGFVLVLVGIPLVWCFVGLMAAVLFIVLYSLVLYKKLEKEGKLDEPAPEVPETIGS